MAMEPFRPDGEPTRVTLRTWTFLTTVLAALVLLGVGYALGYLGAAVAVIFWGGILAYNLSPAYDDNDTDPNPLIKYASVIGVIVVGFIFMVLKHKGTPEEFTGAIWQLGWTVTIMGALFFGAEDYDPETGETKRTVVRKPGRSRRKRQAKQIIDEQGGVIGQTDRLDRDGAGVPRSGDRDW